MRLGNQGPEQYLRRRKYRTGKKFLFGDIELIRRAQVESTPLCKRIRQHRCQNHPPSCLMGLFACNLMIQ